MFTGLSYLGRLSLVPCALLIPELVSTFKAIASDAGVLKDELVKEFGTRVSEAVTTKLVLDYL